MKIKKIEEYFCDICGNDIKDYVGKTDSVLLGISKLYSFASVSSFNDNISRIAKITFEYEEQNNICFEESCVCDNCRLFIIKEIEQEIIKRINKKRSN